MLGGEAQRHQSVLRLEVGKKCLRGRIPVVLNMRMESVDDAPVDGDGGRYQGGTVLAPRARVGFQLDTGLELEPFNLEAVYEHDLVTGFIADDAEIAGEGYPYDRDTHDELRKAQLRVSLGTALHLMGGFMVSDWGLGLLANGGERYWQPGRARFVDPRSGDRVLRGALATGPHTDARIFAVAAVDKVIDDDIMLTDEESDAADDEANQFVGGFTVGYGGPHQAGAYVARRLQDSQEGAETQVWAIDVTGKTELAWEGGLLTLATEAVYITGTTELTPTSDFVEHDVEQFGAAFQSVLDLGMFGAAFDFLYASGDQNLDDGAQNAFRADPNYELGLLLYRHVMTAQTARGLATASDLTLVGVPADDLERLPTRSSPTNTIAVFPRLRFRPVDGLEAYGGPLFAWSATKLVDPFRTRTNGGEPHTALNGKSGRYLGTELDVGVRYRALLWGSELTIGVEGGVLKPGSALRGPNEAPRDNTLGLVRAMMDYRL